MRTFPTATPHPSPRRRPARGLRAAAAAALLAAAACGNSTGAVPTYDPTEVLERFDVAVPAAQAAWGTGHLAFPHALRLRSGEVLVSWRMGAEHMQAPSRLVLARYRDEGGTLTLVETGDLLDTPDDEREAGLVELADGTVLANAFTGRFTEYHRADGELWRLMVLRSGDGGRTWADTVTIQPGDVRDPRGRAFHWLATRAPVVEAGGELLMPVYGILTGGDSRHSAHVLRSADGGRTWRYGAPVARDGNQRLDFNEMSLLVEGSRVVAVFRSEDQWLRQAESADGGRTWSRPRRLDVWGVPPHLLRLRDGTVLLTHGYRGDDGAGVRYALSRDAAATWDPGVEGVLDGTSQSLDCGYPSTVQLDDGSLFTVYYAAHGGAGTTTGIRAVRYRVGPVPAAHGR